MSETLRKHKERVWHGSALILFLVRNCHLSSKLTSQSVKLLKQSEIQTSSGSLQEIYDITPLRFLAFLWWDYFRSSFIFHLHLLVFKQRSRPPLITFKRHRLNSWVVVIETPEQAAEYSQSDRVSVRSGRLYQCAWMCLQAIYYCSYGCCAWHSHGIIFLLCAAVYVSHWKSESQIFVGASNFKILIIRYLCGD